MDTGLAAQVLALAVANAGFLWGALYHAITNRFLRSGGYRQVTRGGVADNAPLSLGNL